jgi:iron complex transport system substrate-binding protein
VTHREFFDALRSHDETHERSGRPATVSTLVPALLLACLGAAVPAAAAPVRVAVLLPYVEDGLDGLDAKVEVVAVVRRDLRRAPEPPRVDLGNPHAPSFEKLAEARPDVIVGERALHGPMRERLERSGEVLLVESDGVEKTFAGLLAIGRRVGAADAMTARVTDARKRLDGLVLVRRTPALVVFGAPGSFLVVSPRTWLGDLVARLGFENVAAAASGQERHPGFVQVSDEVLATLRPELVLLVAHGDPEAIRAAFTKRLEDDGAWAGMRAAATRGVHVLPGPLFQTNPGLAVPEAARVLHDLAGPPLAGPPVAGPQIGAAR